jgi:hypothetical protein
MAQQRAGFSRCWASRCRPRQLGGQRLLLRGSLPPGLCSRRNNPEDPHHCQQLATLAAGSLAVVAAPAPAPAPARGLGRRAGPTAHFGWAAARTGARATAPLGSPAVASNLVTMQWYGCYCRCCRCCRCSSSCASRAQTLAVARGRRQQRAA